MSRYATPAEVEMLTGERQPSNQRLYCHVTGISCHRRFDENNYPIDECLVRLDASVEARLAQALAENTCQHDIPAVAWWSIAAAIGVFLLGQFIS